jgi:MFS family permease
LLVTFALLFVLLQFTNNVAHSPWSAIIADKVPQNQRGITAGYNGLFTLVGSILGSVIAGVIVNKNDALPLYKNEIMQIFLLIALVQIVFVVYTVLTVKETPLHEHAQFELASVIKTFFFKPSRYPDLFWVLLARLLVMMGIWGVFYFLQYYFDDVLGGPGVKTIIFGSNFSGEGFSGTLFLPVLLLFALPTSLIAGWLSDRHGRKVMVYTSGAVMTAVCVVFILFQNQYGSLIAAAFFGIGYGAYTSVDWALTTDALPPTDEAGKFMGIWSAMGILPQVIGIAIGAVILQLLRGIPNHFGYTLLFLVTIVYFGLGTLVIRQVKGVR